MPEYRAPRFGRRTVKLSRSQPSFDLRVLLEPFILEKTQMEYYQTLCLLRLGALQRTAA